MRTLEILTKQIREELRAEGPDSAGYSDFFIQNAINSAIADLSEMFPVRDSILFPAEAGANTYDLGLDVAYDVVAVEYDGRPIEGMDLKDYMSLVEKNQGAVKNWVIWGTSFVLVGEVEEGKDVTVWITRPPKRLENLGDVPEVPNYADAAITAYAISACYRESRSYDRADYYYRIFINQKNNILRRGVPQRQKDHLPKMGDSYWKAFRPNRRYTTSDTNPGGKYR